MKRIYVFDFDGTLTRRDSLTAFISLACGKATLWRELLRLAPRLVLMKLGLCDNGLTKERLFARCFAGMELTAFDDICRRFARKDNRLLRKDAVACLQKLVKTGETIFVVSASIDNWVRPVFLQFLPDGAVTVVGTQVEVKDNRLTGRFLTPNCYGPEKVRRLQEVVPDLLSQRSRYHIVAYGDSRGDKQLLDYADESHYKPFRG